MGKILSTTTIHITPLLARLILGQSFLVLGWYKLNHLSDIKSQFTSGGVPFPELLAPLVGGVELLAGGLLLVGLFTTWSSLALLAVMIGALVTVHLSQLVKGVLNPWPAPGQELASIIPLLYALPLLWLALTGPGMLSLAGLLGAFSGLGKGGKSDKGEKGEKPKKEKK